MDVFAGRIVTLQSGLGRITLESRKSLKRRVREGLPVPVRLVRDAQGAALTVDLGVPTTSGLAWLEVDTGNAGLILISRKLSSLFHIDPTDQESQRLDFPFSPGLCLQGNAQVLDLILDGNIGRTVLDHWTTTIDLRQERGWISTQTGGTAKP